MAICLNCKKEFRRNNNVQKYCSNECKLAYKFPKKCCVICGVEFQPNFKKQKTCSSDCRYNVTILSRKESRHERYVFVNCANCNKQIEVPKDNITLKKYCSTNCFYNHKYRLKFGIDKKHITKTCEACGDKFITSFIRRGRRFCSKTCATTGKNNGMFGKSDKSAWKGKPAWNRGLTTKNSKRVAELGRKISIRSKEQFRRGERSHAGKHNSMYGHTPDMLTAEQVERYSKAAIERIQRGVAGYGTGHVTGIYHCKKSQQTRFKSSWELAAMMWWDKQDDVISYLYEPFVVKLQCGKRTIPDFIVEYDNGKKIIFEIKPTILQSLDKIKSKLDATRIELSKMGYDYQLIGNNEINFMISELNDYDKIVESYRSRNKRI